MGHGAWGHAGFVQGRGWVGWAFLCAVSLIAQPSAIIVDRIEFSGNSAFPAEELQKLLTIRAVSRSTFHRLLLFYTRNLQRNPATPAPLLRQLQTLSAAAEAALPALDPRQLEADRETLRRFYIQNGFHRAEITTRLLASPEGTYTLRFLITEGPAARIDTLRYLGLDELPAELQRELRRYRNLRSGMRFRETALIEELETLRRFLHEHGYPYATYERPQVSIVPEYNTYNVTVRFLPGPRLRFGRARFVETSTNASPLTERIRTFCTEFRPGQWYDIRAVERTRLRLLRLGVFEVVRIDSLIPRSADSSVDVVFSTRYRRPREALLSMSLYRTPLENAPSVGVELQLSDVNLFGGGEKGQVVGQVSVRDPLGALERGQLEYEFTVGTGLSLPYVLRRVGVSSQVRYGIRFLAAPLQLEALGLQLRAPVEFAPWTWMTTTELTVDIRAERPLNYLKAVAAVDTIPALAPFLQQYEQLYRYTHNGQRLLPPSDVALSLTLGADHRDHPTTPRSGHVLLTTLDIGGLGTLGLAQYTRLQLLALGFAPLSPRTVAAGKARFGIIWWRNREHSYVPYDRHFFAGGANSVRGWASRSLWDPVSGGIASGAASALASYIGGGLLVEGSCELRWRLPPVRMGLLTPYISNVVVVSFVDWGNAYNRLTPELYGRATLGSVLRALALSAGIGVGYLTDVGPIRIDAALRLHDPLNPTAAWVFQQPMTLRRWMLHLGLGYAF